MAALESLEYGVLCEGVPGTQLFGPLGDVEFKQCGIGHDICDPSLEFCTIAREQIVEIAQILGLSEPQTPDEKIDWEDAILGEIRRRNDDGEIALLPCPGTGAKRHLRTSTVALKYSV